MLAVQVVTPLSKSSDVDTWHEHAGSSRTAEGMWRASLPAAGGRQKPPVGALTSGAPGKMSCVSVQRKPV